MTRATSSQKSITIKDCAKSNPCEINSIWLPRQVNSKTYHCVHGGDLSDGGDKKNKSVLFCAAVSLHPFTHTFRESLSKGATPLEGMLQPRVRPFATEH